MRFQYALFYFFVFSEEVILMYYIIIFCGIYAPVVDRWMIGVIISTVTMIIIEFAIPLAIGGLRAVAKLKKKL